MSDAKVLDPFDLGTIGLGPLGFGSLFLGLFDDDNLFGTDLNDLMFDLFGNDTMNGGGGDDILIGGLGDDVLNGDGASQIEQVETFLVNEELIGDDLLWGGLGDDTLNGNGGNDMLFGSFGNDTLNGGSGDDLLSGGFGDDYLTGGPGQDTFVFSFGDDIISDFSHDTKTTEVLIDFEGVTTGGTSTVPGSYLDLNWSNVSVSTEQYLIDIGLSENGYGDVLNSGMYFGFNGWGDTASFNDPIQDFDFQSGYFSAAWNNDLNLLITSYDDGVEVGNATIVLDPNKVYLNFAEGTAEGADSAVFTGRFTSVDTIRISASGGTSAGLDGGGTHVAFDDLTLAYTVPGDGDLIDLPWGLDPADIVASATSDGSGGTLLDSGIGTLQLLGVTPADVAEAWFV